MEIYISTGETMPTTTDDAFAAVETAARTPRRDVRRVETMTIGQIARQGDVYLVRVAPDHPHGDGLPHRQVQAGTATGSRHIVAAPAVLYAGTTWPTGLDDRRGVIGPLIRGPERVILTHPEHAQIDIPAGSYQSFVQIDPLTRLAVQD